VVLLLTCVCTFFPEQEWEALLQEVSLFLAADVAAPRSPGLECPFKPSLRCARKGFVLVRA